MTTSDSISQPDSSSTLITKLIDYHHAEHAMVKVYITYITLISVLSSIFYIFCPAKHELNTESGNQLNIIISVSTGNLSC